MENNALILNVCIGSSAESLPEIIRLAASRGKAAARFSSNPPSQFGQKRPVSLVIEMPFGALIRRRQVVWIARCRHLGVVILALCPKLPAKHLDTSPDQEDSGSHNSNKRRWRLEEEVVLTPKPLTVRGGPPPNIDEQRECYCDFQYRRSN